MSHEVKIYPLIAQAAGPGGRVLNVKWPDIEVLHLDGREIAKIKTKPGAEIGLHPGVYLTQAERAAVEAAVAKARGGVKPSNVVSKVEVPYEILDEVLPQREEEETDLEDDDE